MVRLWSPKPGIQVRILALPHISNGRYPSLPINIMDPIPKRKIVIGFFLFISLIILWQIYAPQSLQSVPPVIYTVLKGQGNKEIAEDLKNQGIIKNPWFFRLYVVMSGKHQKLQAGSYEISPSISVAQIVKKLTSGDVIKNTVTIIEGWNINDIGQYLESKKICTRADFSESVKKDYSNSFEFLKTKPQKLSLEGYIFPDTYQLAIDGTPETLLKTALANFDKKLTPQLREEIALQKKTIFQIITMASLIEKEVRSPEDKKIVAGILWKRLENNMLLQVDATINYITGKNNPSSTIKDTTIDSPYNTYKYPGLPLGPISNAGIESILAAIYPQKSDWWYYLSAPETKKTIFSKTLEEHNTAVAKYLR